MNVETSRTGAGGFGATRWSLVMRAHASGPEARAALAELCEAYYEPVYRFLRRDGRDEDAARELAQAFFAGVLGRGGVGLAEPGQGRFRSYLLGAVRHFLADQRKHSGRLKRGGGIVPESLDAEGPGDDAPAIQVADPDAGPADYRFDRDWALAVLGRAIGSLEREYREAGKGVQFEALEPWLVGDAEGLSQVEAGRRLGFSESAVKVAVHRMRKRFRELLREEVCQTLAEGDDPEAELRYLAEVLSRQPC